jgi:Nitroreductase family
MISRRRFIGLTATGAVVGLTGCAGSDAEKQRYRTAAAKLRATIIADPHIAELVRFATLAPNGHNTQPWRFAVAREQIRIEPDMARRTPAVDPDDHHLYVGLGCAAENLALAARAFGREGELTFVPGAEGTIACALGRSGVAALDPFERPFFDAIPARQSTRSDYDGRAIGKADRAKLEAAARTDGVALMLLTDTAKRESVLEQVIAGNSAQMDDPSFVDELKHWIRFTPEDAIRTSDGLYAECSGNPVLPTWLGKRMFPLVFTKSSENDKYARQIRSSAGIAVFIGDHADPDHWTRVGRSYERFALQATALGIRTAHINQPVEVVSLRREFARWLGIGNARPDLVIRFGRAAPMPMSMRRAAKDVMFLLEG